jgi:hypothetical protein
MERHNGPIDQCILGTLRTQCRKYSTLVWRGVFGISLLVYGAAVSACGGGSSGTGESGSLGQILDRSCQPLGSVDLSAVGLETTDQFSAEDGTFRLAQTTSSRVQVSDGTRGVDVDISAPTCILIVYDQGQAVSVSSYPLTELSGCSIEGIQGRESLNEPLQCGE